MWKAAQPLSMLEATKGARIVPRPFILSQQHRQTYTSTNATNLVQRLNLLPQSSYVAGNNQHRDENETAWNGRIVKYFCFYQIQIFLYSSDERGKKCTDAFWKSPFPIEQDTCTHIYTAGRRSMFTFKDFLKSDCGARLSFMKHSEGCH